MSDAPGPDGPQSTTVRMTLAEVLEDSAPGAQLDLLVVEDHEPTRRAMELALGHLGHLVVSAATLGDARSLLRTLAVDAIVCDVALPDGDARALVADWPEASRRVPAIAISGVKEADLGEACLQSDFDAFLSKPLHVQKARRHDPPSDPSRVKLAAELRTAAA